MSDQGGTSDQGGLVPDEGVDEGSAASAVEGPDGPGHRDTGLGDAGRGGDLLGEPPRGAPADETQAAGPVDMETEESRAVRAERGAGQQLQEGEG